MLSESENKLLTQTGANTPLGRLMRQYWVPVILSSKLSPGAAPERITVMGDKLVAYRSPGGQVGVMDEACPHRGASLALARNEECGLRCIYHGWKIAPSGELLEAPTFPPGALINATKARVRSRVYPAQERHGIVWAWLGEGEVPAFPRLVFTDLPEGHVIAVTAALNCNWIHPFETLWDIFHAQILHNQTNRAFRGDIYFSKEGRRAGDLLYDCCDTVVERTNYGFYLKNIDAAKETTARFIMPFFQHHAITPPLTDDKGVHISVPIDDDHCRVWEVFYNRFAPLKPDGIAMKMVAPLADPGNFMEGMDIRTPENRWGQNREAMDRGESFSGIVGMKGFSTIMAEDAFVIESQGRLDRSRENLAPTDRAVVEGRRTILDAIRAFEEGQPPLGRDLDLSHVESLFVAKQPVPWGQPLAPSVADAKKY